jgi:hypothetical protein
MYIDRDRIVPEIEKILRWRLDRQEDWSEHKWRGRDQLEVQRELDSDAFQRIKKLFE